MPLWYGLFPFLTLFVLGLRTYWRSVDPWARRGVGRILRMNITLDAFRSWSPQRREDSAATDGRVWCACAVLCRALQKVLFIVVILVSSGFALGATVLLFEVFE